MFNTITEMLKSFGRTVLKLCFLAFCVWAAFWLITLASALAGALFTVAIIGVLINYTFGDFIGKSMRKSLEEERG